MLHSDQAVRGIARVRPRIFRAIRLARVECPTGILTLPIDPTDGQRYQGIVR